jgi:hypothetical protein
MKESVYLTSVQKELRAIKGMADKAISQVSDEDFFRQLDPESNSIAVIVKHLAGSMRSRWQDFLTTDGEKPDRDRDGEFLIEGDTRASLASKWDEGWRLAFDTLGTLTSADLEKEIKIQNEGYTVIGAINRQLAHISNHVGQVALLAKHYAGVRWQTLTVPRNRNHQPLR